MYLISSFSVYFFFFFVISREKERKKLARKSEKEACRFNGFGQCFCPGKGKSIGRWCITYGGNTSQPDQRSSYLLFFWIPSSPLLFFGDDRWSNHAEKQTVDFPVVHHLIQPSFDVGSCSRRPPLLFRIFLIWHFFVSSFIFKSGVCVCVIQSADWPDARLWQVEYKRAWWVHDWPANKGRKADTGSSSSSSLRH